MNQDEYYQKGYHTLQHEHLISDEEYFWARAKASARLYFTTSERDRHVFEYGCGVGQGIAALGNAAGWDVSREARQAARSRGVVVYETLEDVPRNSWEIVLCRHVLEHLGNPLDALRQMRQLVTDGGTLYLILPKERHYSASFEPDLARHLFCWNFRTANNLLDLAGFVPFVNRYCYVLGYRKLLPVKRFFGEHAYLWAIQALGAAWRNGELLIKARPKKA